MLRKLFATLLLLGCCVLPIQKVAAAPLPSEAVVHAVLFYSPNCGHCHYVITEVFPPLFEEHREQLQILSVDVTQPDGQALFAAALSKFGLESSGVPFLVIGDTYLIGSIDIPEQLPGLIEQHLEQGGLDWPDIPGLDKVVEASMPVEEAEPASPATPAPAPEATDVAPSVDEPEPGLVVTGNLVNSVGANFAKDLPGNTLAVIVLVGMVVSVGGSLFFRPAPSSTSAQFQVWMVPLLCVIGLGVAGYLSYVEVAQVEAYCTPVGDCNPVHESPYALLFGVLPVGVLGLVGYIAILAAWAAGRYGKEKLVDLAAAAMLGMTIFGILFSIYLTFLEPFVIGATCAWCLMSAVLMTVLFLLSLAPGRLALSSLLQGEKQASN